MAKPIEREPCPKCGEMIAASALKCRFCGATFEFEDEAKPRPKQSGGVEATDFLVPTNVSGWSLAACYMGLIGVFIPIFAPPALICAIIALKTRKKQPSTYGAVTSDVRAIIGLITGIIGCLCLGGFIVMVIAGALE